MLTKEYEADLEKNKKRVVTNSERTGEIVQDFYFARLSKPIVDKIDTLLAEHYGFTPEELGILGYAAGNYLGYLMSQLLGLL